MSEGSNPSNHPPTQPSVPPVGYEASSLPLGALLLGRYHIIRKLENGGMGSVYLAQDEDTRAFVAIKTLPKDTNEKTRSRFLLESTLMRRITHPNVVRHLGQGEENNQLFYVMDYHPGGSLYDKLSQQGAFPSCHALGVVMELARALIAVHEQGIWHRDLKPDNVLFSVEERPILIDFGVACTQESLTREWRADGELIGTPSYMPPERLSGDETACERSDIYGLGLLLYELLTGNNPLLGLNPSEILHTQLRQTLPPPHKQLHIPKAAYSICQIATSPDPAARYGSVQDFLEACQNALRESLLQRAAPQMLP